MTTPEQVAAAVERLTRFYVIGKLEQAAVHGLPMGLGDSSIVVMQALVQAQAELALVTRDRDCYLTELEAHEVKVEQLRTELKTANAAARRMGRALERAERDNPQFVSYLPEDDDEQP